MSDPQRLRRTHPAPPVRHVHLGLGNFFRAHQAWYTHRANAGLPTQEQWGIAAFTGRSTEVAERLNEQDGLYTLLVTGADASGGVATEVVESLVDARPGTDLEAWHRYLADPAVVVLTTTVTESGYRRAKEGGLDLADPQVRADLDRWRTGERDHLTTAPVRIASGLAARRDAGGHPITIVPCDNLPANGSVAREVVVDAARQMEPALADWVREHVGFVSTAVDRITPRPTDEDRRQVREATGIDDPACVVTEAFIEWDLAGDFPGGRPPWERADAVLTDDVRPYETRKLWLLNGAHSLLAYAGGLRGHETVAEAVADPQVAGWVQQWWDLAIAHLELPEDELRDYTAALTDRFANPAIRHLLAQIAADGTQKLPVRIVPAVRAGHEQGQDVDGGLRALAAWVRYAQDAGTDFEDTGAEQTRGLLEGDLPSALTRVLEQWGLDAALAPRAQELADALTD